MSIWPVTAPVSDRLRPAGTETGVKRAAGGVGDPPATPIWAAIGSLTPTTTCCDVGTGHSETWAQARSAACRMAARDFFDA